jgi:hypothetical protein
VIAGFIDRKTDVTKPKQVNVDDSKGIGQIHDRDVVQTSDAEEPTDQIRSMAPSMATSMLAASNTSSAVTDNLHSMARSNAAPISEAPTGLLIGVPEGAVAVLVPDNVNCSTYNVTQPEADDSDLANDVARRQLEKLFDSVYNGDFLDILHFDPFSCLFNWDDNSCWADCGLVPFFVSLSKLSGHTIRNAINVIPSACGLSLLLKSFNDFNNVKRDLRLIRDNIRDFVYTQAPPRRYPGSHSSRWFGIASLCDMMVDTNNDLIGCHFTRHRANTKSDVHLSSLTVNRHNWEGLTQFVNTWSDDQSNTSTRIELVKLCHILPILFNHSRMGVDYKDCAIPSTMSFNDTKYTLYACVYATHSHGDHFVCRFIHDGQVYLYDDLKNDGVPRIDNDALEGSVLRNINDTKHWTTAVFFVSDAICELNTASFDLIPDEESVDEKSRGSSSEKSAFTDTDHKRESTIRQILLVDDDTQLDNDMDYDSDVIAIQSSSNDVSSLNHRDITTTGTDLIDSQYDTEMDMAPSNTALLSAATTQISSNELSASPSPDPALTSINPMPVSISTTSISHNIGNDDITHLRSDINSGSDVIDIQSTTNQVSIPNADNDRIDAGTNRTELHSDAAHIEPDCISQTTFSDNTENTQVVPKAEFAVNAICDASDNDPFTTPPPRSSQSRLSLADKSTLDYSVSVVQSIAEHLLGFRGRTSRLMSLHLDGFWKLTSASNHEALVRDFWIVNADAIPPVDVNGIPFIEHEGDIHTLPISSIPILARQFPFIWNRLAPTASSLRYALVDPRTELQRSVLLTLTPPIRITNPTAARSLGLPDRSFFPQFIEGWLLNKEKSIVKPDLSYAGYSAHRNSDKFKMVCYSDWVAYNGCCNAALHTSNRRVLCIVCQVYYTYQRKKPWVQILTKTADETKLLHGYGKVIRHANGRRHQIALQWLRCDINITGSQKKHVLRRPTKHKPNMTIRDTRFAIAEEIARTSIHRTDNSPFFRDSSSIYGKCLGMYHPMLVAHYRTQDTSIWDHSLSSPSSSDGQLVCEQRKCRPRCLDFKTFKKKHPGVSSTSEKCRIELQLMSYECQAKIKYTCDYTIRTSKCTGTTSNLTFICDQCRTDQPYLITKLARRQHRIIKEKTSMQDHSSNGINHRYLGKRHLLDVIQSQKEDNKRLTGLIKQFSKRDMNQLRSIDVDKYIATRIVNDGWNLALSIIAQARHTSPIQVALILTLLKKTKKKRVKFPLIVEDISLVLRSSMGSSLYSYMASWMGLCSLTYLYTHKLKDSRYDLGVHNYKFETLALRWKTELKKKLPVIQAIDGHRIRRTIAPRLNRNDEVELVGLPLTMAPGKQPSNGILLRDVINRTGGDGCDHSEQIALTKFVKKEQPNCSSHVELHFGQVACSSKKAGSPLAMIPIPRGGSGYTHLSFLANLLYVRSCFFYKEGNFEHPLVDPIMSPGVAHDGLQIQNTGLCLLMTSYRTNRGEDRRHHILHVSIPNCHELWLVAPVIGKHCCGSVGDVHHAFRLAFRCLRYLSKDLSMWRNEEGENEGCVSLAIIRDMFSTAREQQQDVGINEFDVKDFVRWDQRSDAAARVINLNTIRNLDKFSSHQTIWAMSLYVEATRAIVDPFFEYGKYASPHDIARSVMYGYTILVLWRALCKASGWPLTGNSKGNPGSFLTNQLFGSFDIIRHIPFWYFPAMYIFHGDIPAHEWMYFKSLGTMENELFQGLMCKGRNIVSTTHQWHPSLLESLQLVGTFDAVHQSLHNIAQETGVAYESRHSKSRTRGEKKRLEKRRKLKNDDDSKSKEQRNNDTTSQMKTNADHLYKAPASLELLQDELRRGLRLGIADAKERILATPHGNDWKLRCENHASNLWTDANEFRSRTYETEIPAESSNMDKFIFKMDDLKDNMKNVNCTRGFDMKIWTQLSKDRREPEIDATALMGHPELYEEGGDMFLDETLPEPNSAHGSGKDKGPDNSDERGSVNNYHASPEEDNPIQPYTAVSVWPDMIEPENSEPMSKQTKDVKSTEISTESKKSKRSRFWVTNGAGESIHTRTVIAAAMEKETPSRQRHLRHSASIHVFGTEPRPATCDLFESAMIAFIHDTDEIRFGRVFALFKKTRKSGRFRILHASRDRQPDVQMVVNVLKLVHSDAKDTEPSLRVVPSPIILQRILAREVVFIFSVYDQMEGQTWLLKGSQLEQVLTHEKPVHNPDDCSLRTGCPDKYINQTKKIKKQKSEWVKNPSGKKASMSKEVKILESRFENNCLEYRVVQTAQDDGYWCSKTTICDTFGTTRGEEIISVWTSQARTKRTNRTNSRSSRKRTSSRKRKKSGKRLRGSTSSEPDVPKHHDLFVPRTWPITKPEDFLNQPDHNFDVDGKCDIETSWIRKCIRWQPTYTKQLFNKYIADYMPRFVRNPRTGPAIKQIYRSRSRGVPGSRDVATLVIYNPHPLSESWGVGLPAIKNIRDFNGPILSIEGVAKDHRWVLVTWLHQKKPQREVHKLVIIAIIGKLRLSLTSRICVKGEWIIADEKQAASFCYRMICKCWPNITFEDHNNVIENYIRLLCPEMVEAYQNCVNNNIISVTMHRNTPPALSNTLKSHIEHVMYNGTGVHVLDTHALKYTCFVNAGIQLLLCDRRIYDLVYLSESDIGVQQTTGLRINGKDISTQSTVEEQAAKEIDERDATRRGQDKKLLRLFRTLLMDISLHQPLPISTKKITDLIVEIAGGGSKTIHSQEDAKQMWSTCCDSLAVFMPSYRRSPYVFCETSSCTADRCTYTQASKTVEQRRIWIPESGPALVSIACGISKLFAHHTEEIEGVNCSGCKKKTTFSRVSNTTYVGGTLLPMVLRRGQTRELHTQFQIPNFLYPHETKLAVPLVLRAVSMHTGTQSSGHYYAYVTRDSYDKRLTYHCDDEQVLIIGSFRRVQMKQEKEIEEHLQIGNEVDIELTQATVQSLRDKMTHLCADLVLFEVSTHYYSFRNDSFMQDVVFSGIRQFECVVSDVVLSDLWKLQDLHIPSFNIVTAVVTQMNTRNIEFIDSPQHAYKWGFIQSPIQMRANRPCIGLRDQYTEMCQAVKGPTSLLIPIYISTTNTWLLVKIGLHTDTTLDLYSFGTHPTKPKVMGRVMKLCLQRVKKMYQSRNKSSKSPIEHHGSSPNFQSVHAVSCNTHDNEVRHSINNINLIILFLTPDLCIIP